MVEINGEVLPPLQSEEQKDKKEPGAISEPIIKRTGAGRPPKNKKPEETGLSYKKTGEQFLKLADKVKQSQKGEEIDKTVRKDFNNALSDYLDSKDLKFLQTGPLLPLIIASVELIADMFDLTKVTEWIQYKHLEIKEQQEKKKNEIQPTKK